MRILLALIIAHSIAAPVFSQDERRPKPVNSLNPDQLLQKVEAARFHKLLDQEWEWFLQTDPTEASYYGVRTYNDRWPTLTVEAFNEGYEHNKGVLKELATIDIKKLGKQDRISYRLFERQTRMLVEGHQYKYFYVPLTNREGIQIADQVGEYVTYESLDDYEDWIKRLESFDTYMDQTLAFLDAGIKERIVHARVAMEPVVGQIEKQLVKKAEDSPFYNPFRKMNNKIPAAKQEELRERARRAISKKVIPAYQKMLVFFKTKYLQGCFDEVGCRQIPNGDKFYAYRCRQYTTTDLTPKEIHEIGMTEVKRIRAEMEQIQKDVGFKGTFAEFLEYLRTDEQFYFKSENEYLQAAQATCKKVDPQLVRLFKTLPRMPYGVEAIPANIAPDTSAAYYRGPAKDGSRAGTYFLNTFDLKSRPKYEIEALSLHEAVPGHHMQISLAQELDDLPEFRRYVGYTAYIEGWGLYSESLGDELGLYQDPYSKFGQLTYEIWRACRLVIDTGVHSMGWTRQQSIDFLANNSAKSILDITNEVDRYIAWPGQALAYKIGELKIKELRERATRELGDKFDIREFHDVVLMNGAVTLDVLEQLVDEWIAEAKAKPNQ